MGDASLRLPRQTAVLRVLRLEQVETALHFGPHGLPNQWCHTAYGTREANQRSSEACFNPTLVHLQALFARLISTALAWQSGLMVREQL